MKDTHGPSHVIELEKGRLLLTVRRGFRNWVSRFKEAFGADTRLGDLSCETLSCLAQGKENSTFYLYDLIMALKNLGSGFEFHELDPKRKMSVMDIHLFLLDRIRFECMKRLHWIDAYPGEEFTLVELIVQFDKLGPNLQARVPRLSQGHPDYPNFSAANTFDREMLIRKLIPKLITEITRYSDIR